MRKSNIDKLKQIHDILEALVVPVQMARQVILCTDTIRGIIEEEKEDGTD